jgi:isopentenyl-diphosphate delta-isomerase type 1
LDFFDPYQSKGGFGASSAQYCSLAILRKIYQKRKINFLTLLKEYQDLSEITGYYPPSGVDVIAQLNGGITFFHKEEKKLSRLTWPFPDIYFALLHTGYKINTSLSLQTLQPPIDICELNKIVLQGYQSLRQENSADFCHAINAYGKQLAKNNLVIPEVNALLADLHQHREILAAKGCGALSADVILVLLRKEYKQFIKNWAQQKNLQLIIIDNYASDGASVVCQKSFKKQLIAVDKNDNQIDIVEKLTAHKRAILHRAYSVFIFRKKKNALELLLQQRAADKYHSGNLWTNTCCSHSIPGVDTKQSAKQRLQEEMGINAELFEVGAFRYKAKLNKDLIEHEYDHVFVGSYESSKLFKPNKKEVAGFRWVDLVTLKKELTLEPKKFTPWLKPALELILRNHILNKWLSKE